MTKLTTSKRNSLPAEEFAEQAKRKYPIPDIGHARNALSRVSGNGTPSEKKMVQAEVHRRYPQINSNKK